MSLQKLIEEREQKIKEFNRETTKLIIDGVVEMVKAEKLTDNTGEPDDIAYNQALDDIISQLQTLKK